VVWLRGVDLSITDHHFYPTRSFSTHASVFKEDKLPDLTHVAVREAGRISQENLKELQQSMAQSCKKVIETSIPRSDLKHIIFNFITLLLILLIDLT
jgi:hypothetical protein